MSTRRPGPILRSALRLPARLYDWHVGWLLGDRFLRLTHVGRRTGNAHQTILEVVGTANGEVIVMAGFGRSANWYRNLQAQPATEVAIGSRRFRPLHRTLGEVEASAVIADYERRHRLAAPFVRAVLSRLVGWRYDGSDEARQRLVRELPLVGFRPQETPTADVKPAGSDRDRRGDTSPAPSSPAAHSSPGPDPAGGRRHGAAGTGRDPGRGPSTNRGHVSQVDAPTLRRLAAAAGVSSPALVGLLQVLRRMEGLLGAGVAAALLHRFHHDEDVSESYRGIGDVRWLVCQIDAVDAGALLLEAALEKMRAWQVQMVGADCFLPALGCYGVPDTLPHIRGLPSDAGFGDPTRTELVLAARCDALTGHRLDGATIKRTLGHLGARFTLSQDDGELGFIEVCDQPPDMARSSVAVRWADIGNLILHGDADPAKVVPALLSAGAEWLLLGGVTRLLEYWAEDVEPPDRLAQLENAGFRTLVRNERGFRRASLR